MKFKFSYLLGLSALLVAGCAAYFSVFGLSQLFAGAGISIVIMASSLELSKVITVSFLHRYWGKISNGLKTYLTIGVVVLVFITSAGIYGFLSNAYQQTSNKLEIHEGQLSVLDSKKQIFQKNIDDNQNIIQSKNKRINQLTNLRGNQENRLDSAKTNKSKDKVRGDIDIATKEIQKLNIDIDELNIKNNVLSDSVGKYSVKELELKSNSVVVGEVGPLKFLSVLTHYSMDKIVNCLILLLIFVFDPLAVALVIATNKVYLLENPPSEPIKPAIKEPIEMVEEFDDIEPIEEPFINDVTEPISEPIIEPIIETKKEPVVPTGKIELEDIKEIKENKENIKRGFSVPIPQPKSNNSIERIGTNKVIRDGNNSNLIFKRNK